jgi:hypothetical protein
MTKEDFNKIQLAGLRSLIKVEEELVEFYREKALSNPMAALMLDVSMIKLGELSRQAGLIDCEPPLRYYKKKSKKDPGEEPLYLNKTNNNNYNG